MDILGLDDDWNATDEGDFACYTQAPDQIPAHQVARVIYELRCDIGRLNSEVVEGNATIADLHIQLEATLTALQAAGALP